MTEKRVSIGGKPAILSRLIGRGGEGDVYLVEGQPDIAVKIYTVNVLGDRPAKIQALVSAKLAEKEQLVAFPIAEVISPSGKFLGFAMRLIAGCKPLHELYAPGSRKLHFPNADFRFLVRTAANVARAVAAVHRNSCVIGDINHSGILVSPKAMVALIDADSFQVSANGGQFLCKVGVPEYTPPELQGGSLVGITRTPNHDAFGLAVVIFQLLFMGRHPFVGTVRKGEIPPIHENIAAHRYVYTDKRDVGMDQPPGTPSIEDFFPPLAKAFDDAFLTKQMRPSAESWVQVLHQLEQSLVKCQDNELHFIPKDASECAWCEMDRQLGTVLFLPQVTPATMVQGRDPGFENFDVDAIWRAVEAVRIATNTRLSPNAPSVIYEPTEEARKAKAGGEEWSFFGISMIIAGIVGFLATPSAFIFWGILCFIGFTNSKSTKKFDLTPFTSSYVVSEQIYQRELGNWEKRNGVGDFLKLYSELESARNEYLSTKKQEASEIAHQGNQRREAQLNAYLDTFPIEQANIRGIGPSIRATLASYGVSTAADITQRKIQAISGVGEKISEKLLGWRAKLESQFVYRQTVSALDQAAIAQARAKAESKIAPLRTKLVAGPQNLSALAARMRVIVSTEDEILGRALKARDQAKTNLEFLGIPLPKVQISTRHVGVTSPTQHRVTSFSTKPSSPPTSSGTSTTQQRGTAYVPKPSTPPTNSGSAPLACPRCGSGMIKRLAKRGRNAGGYFWGCSRYPSCKGTRNI
jgi:DNA-binding helix-hairpin-helix protein with protein kinase domain